MKKIALAIALISWPALAVGNSKNPTWWDKLQFLANNPPNPFQPHPPPGEANSLRRYRRRTKQMRPAEQTFHHHHPPEPKHHRRRVERDLPPADARLFLHGRRRSLGRRRSAASAADRNQR